jgi:hypothetical protein
MGKVKKQMMDNEWFSQTIQQPLWTAEQLNGLVNTISQYRKDYKQVFDGLPSGNNSSCQSTATEKSVVSKPKTLILNGQARPSITTSETKAGTQLSMAQAKYWF